jgi:hypothetical protein
MATAGFLLLVGSASAQCIPALCAIAITVQSDASGIVLGGSGTSSVTLAFGSMQAFGGTNLTGVTKTVTGSTWTASTPIDIKVTCTIILTLLPCLAGVSPSYTLTAQLQNADGINTWKVGGLTVTSGGTTTLTAIGTFSQVTSYQFALTIPFTESPGAITNHINLVATSN